MISFDFTQQRGILISSVRAIAALWLCTSLQATVCPLQEYPLWVNTKPTLGEPLIFSLRSVEDAAAAMKWKYSLTIGEIKQRLTPMRLNGGGRFIVIKLPVLQAGSKYKFSAVPPKRCKSLCGRTISARIQIVDFEFSLEPESENTPSDLTFTGVQQQTLWFSLAAKGRPVLVRIDQLDAKGNKTVAYNVIPEITIPVTPGLRYPLSNRGCETLDYQLESGNTYSIFLYAAQHGKYEPLSGWTFAIPLPPVWSAGDSTEFERDYKTATAEGNKCDQLGYETDVEIRKRCKEVYDRLLGLERKRKERDGKYFEYGADRLNLQPVHVEAIPPVAFTVAH